MDPDRAKIDFLGGYDKVSHTLSCLVATSALAWIVPTILQRATNRALSVEDRSNKPCKYSCDHQQHVFVAISKQWDLGHLHYLL